MLDQLRVEDFLPLVGTKLEVESSGRNVQLELIEATIIPSPSPRPAPAFHLILRSPANLHAAQGIWHLHHPALGVLDVFTVPIGPDAKGQCYEIIFN